MIIIYIVAMTILKYYSYIVIANVILSWLVAFNIINTGNYARSNALLAGTALKILAEGPLAKSF